MMAGDDGLQDALAARLECRQRTGLVGLHHAAVADDVSGKNGGESALGAFFGHARRSFSWMRDARLYGRRREVSIEPDVRSVPMPIYSGFS
jgi:ribulose kinase